MKCLQLVAVATFSWIRVCLANDSHQSAATDIEDLKKLLHLNAGAQLLKQLISGSQDEGSFATTTKDGRIIRFADSDLVPLFSLFDSTFFHFNDNGTVQNKKTGVTIPVSVFRYTDDDGTVVQVTKNENGTIDFVEIHEGSSSVTYLVKSSNVLNVKDDGSYLTFAEGDITENFNVGDGVPIPDKQDGGSRHVRRRTVHKSRGVHHKERDLVSWTRGDSTAVDCRNIFTIVNIAVAYDEEFCRQYGSHNDAKRRIELTVAGASVHYENDMCIKLVLTDIIEPTSCEPPLSGVYQSMNRDNACRNDPERDHFLYAFTKHMRQHRFNSDVSVDDGTLIQLFSGYPHPGAELGCTWTKTYCDIAWAYGINYMGNVANPGPEIVIFTHELAHSLGAPHYQENNREFIMTPWVTSGKDGFSLATVNTVMDHITGTSCYKTELVTTQSQVEITATVYWPRSNYIYFFFKKDNVALYSRYEVDKQAVPPGYPRPASDFWQTWPDIDWLPTSGFVSNDGQRLYLFKGGSPTTFVNLLVGGSQRDGASARSIGCCWRGLPPNMNYNGMVLWPDGKLYLFAGDQYYMYDTNRHRAGDHYPRDVRQSWNNWPNGFQASSGTVTRDDRYAYIFGVMRNDPLVPVYLRYNINANRVDNGYPRRVKDDWNGVIP